MDKNPYKLFFDRQKNTVDGNFTVLDVRTGWKVFNRLPARSGQEGYTNGTREGVRGKSPIPYGVHKLLLSNPRQPKQWPGANGIGEFWPIYNVDGNTRLIRGKNGEERWDIGLHPENRWRGSAGCIVLVHDTYAQRKELVRLHYFLMSLIGKYPYIPLEVL